MDTFAQILADKLQESSPTPPKHSPSPPSFAREVPVPPPPFSAKHHHWPRQAQGTRAYPQTKKNRAGQCPKASPSPTPAPPPERRWTFSELDQKRQKDLQCLVGLGAHLKDSFSKTQLRSEYLRLLKVWHPDLSQTGHTQEFMQLLAAYRSLKAYLELQATS